MRKGKKIIYGGLIALSAFVLLDYSVGTYIIIPLITK